MATLTETAYYTRRGVNIFIISVIGFFVLRASYHAAQDIWSRLRPTQPDKPTLAFGKLPQIDFPEEINRPPDVEEPREIVYTLETIEGILPEFPLLGKVYFMPQKKPGLLAFERAKEVAASYDFKDEPEMIADNIVYRWWREAEPSAFLEMDTYTTHFTFRFFYEEDSSLVDKKNVATEDGAKSEAQKYFGKGGYLNKELSDGEAEVVYYFFIPPHLYPAASISEASFFRVNLFRVNLDELRILPPNPKESLVTILFTGDKSANKRVAEAKFNSYPIERETFATYPLKPADAAWRELQDNKGYIAYLGENSDGKITIRKVTLAYFESEKKQDFLQPIYVFEGDRDFFAYIPAIDPEWQE
jgi:hypothetical protein